MFALCCLWLLLLTGGCAPSGPSLAFPDNSPVAPPATDALAPPLAESLSPPPERVVRLVFTGDIMAHAEQLSIARRPDGSHDFSGQFAPVLPLLSGDLTVGNFETVLGGPERPYTGYPSFNTPDTLADALKDAGFDVLLLANNHILDLGAKAALRTDQVLRDKGFAVTGLGPGEAGHPPPLLCDAGGLRLGLLNYTYGSNRLLTPALERDVALNVIDSALLAEDVRTLRDQGARYIVAALHWGIEYQPQPSPAQRAVAAHCLSLGVDAVVGAHPHILQAVEIHTANGKPQLVAWSLGNFVSAQRTVPRERAIILALDVACPARGEPRLLRASVAPTWVDLSPARRQARILPTLPRLLPDGVDEERAALLARVNAECLAFLGLPPLPDSRGFYTVYQAPSLSDWLPWPSVRAMRFFPSTAWFRQAAVWSRLVPSEPEENASPARPATILPPPGDPSPPDSAGNGAGAASAS